jgi:uncharacterized protein (TIGR02246 family)
MALQMNRSDAQAEINALLDDWASAVRAKDLDRIFAHYARDILAFDAIAQLQFKGTEAYRRHWQACMAMCPGQMIFEVHDLTISTGDDVAFCHYLSRCGGTGAEGEEKVGWMRATAGLRRRGGRWLIVHEHFSAPFDPASGKALLHLEP